MTRKQRRDYTMLRSYAQARLHAGRILKFLEESDDKIRASREAERKNGFQIN